MKMLDSGYKRLNGKTGFMGTRNTTFFGILVGLVVLLALFYLYVSASNEVVSLQHEIESQDEHISKLKNEILETTVSLEKAKSGESACQNTKDVVEKKADDCATELDKLKASISDLESTVSEKEESIKALKLDLAEKATQLEQDVSRKSAMAQAGVGQEAIIIKLNETLELMKKDLALKDDVIHGLKTKLGLPVDDVAVVPLPDENKALNESNVDVNGFTVPSVKREDDNSENVIPVPNKPDENGHLSALDIPEEKNSADVNPNDKPVENPDKLPVGAGNVVVRDAQARMKLNDEVQEEKNEDDKEELADAMDFGGQI